MVRRDELRKLIPHGYCKEVAKQAGVSTQAVSEYFAGKHNSERIENAALKIALKIKSQKEKLLKQIHG